MTAEQLINIMFAEGQIMTIYDFHDCDFDDKYSFGHGGDEDYIIIYSNDFYRAETAVRSLAVCDSISREYTVNGRQYTISITSHA